MRHPGSNGHETPAPSAPLDALWQAPVILSVIVAGEGLAAILAMSPGAPGNRWAYFGLASLLVQWVVLSTLGGMFLFRRTLARRRPLHVAYAALGLLMLSTWVVALASRVLVGEDWGAGPVDWLDLFLRFSGIALAVGLLALAAFQNHWRARQAALRAKQSELEALQARIRPHFLFNTLNTGAALVHAQPEAAERLLLDLADLFRAALSGPREIPLEDELALARRYLEIEGLRFGPRLQVSWDLPEPLPRVAVPTLSIQPLVENAIRHGIEPAAAGGRLDICVREGAAGVQVRVRNDLPGAGARPAVGHQVGLASARERIRALSEGRGRLETRVEDGRYVATILLPPPQPTTR